jgi:hypothetical protein
MSRLSKVVGDYLQAFASKDIEKLTSLLAQNVVLRDWTLCEQGIVPVKAATLHIFESCTTIEVVPVHMVVGEKVVIAELLICFDGNEPIHIVDVYEFDKNERIVAIRAYKG